MAYAALSQTAFQAIGGFAMAQLLLPRSFFDPQHAAQVQRQKLQNQEQQQERPLEQQVRKLATKIQSFCVSPPSCRTLPQDISFFSEEYRALWTAGVTLAVVAGGPMSILGAGAAVAFMGNDGNMRYIKVKRWIQSVSSGVTDSTKRMS